MSDTLVLDPAEVASPDRTELDLNTAPITIAQAGIDWGQAEIEAFMADHRVGSIPVDYRLPNRTVTIPLVLKAGGSSTFAQARALLQAKVGLLQRKGGWVKRGRTEGDLFGDVVNATLTMPDSWEAAHIQAQADVVLTLECIPDFYAEETTVSLGSSTNELIATGIAVAGDYPARCRIEIEETSGHDQRGLLFCARNTPAATADMAFDSGTWSFTTDATTLASDIWLPILDLGDLAHVGPHRVWLKTKGVAMLRLEWGPSGSINRNLNPIQFIGSADHPVWVDLGEINPPLALVGDQAWTGRILGQLIEDFGHVATPDVTPTRLLVLPSGDCYGSVRVTNSVPTSSPDLYDDFSGLALGDPLATSTLPTGQTWATITGSASGDFTGLGSRGVVRGSDDGGVVTTGRWSRAGSTTYTDIRVTAGILGSTGGLFRTGVFARLVDKDNWIMAALESPEGGGGGSVAVYKNVATTITQLGLLAVPDLFRSLSLTVTADGLWSLTQWSPFASEPSTPSLFGNDDALATGGALETGKVGLYDGGTATNLRKLYGFAAFTSIQREAVLIADGEAELRTAGYLRSNGSDYANLPVFGDLPRIPVGASVDVLLRPTSGDLATEPELYTPSTSASLNFAVSTLFVPS